MSRYSQVIASYTEGRKTSYDVTAELKVRKMLEKHTLNDWKLEFSRNEDKYATDITCFRYEISDSWDKGIVAYIEVEETEKWYNNIYPKNWKTYSYLARKVLRFDRIIGEFTDKPIDNADTTFYLKVARDLSDCHCSLVLDIANHYQKKWIDNTPNLGSDDYNRLCLRFDITSPYVKRGWKQTIEMIKSKITRIKR